MDEDEERKLAEASGHHPHVTDKPDIAYPVHDRIEAFDIGDSGFIAKDDKALQAISPADRVYKDDDFEQVSQEKAANESQADLKEPGGTEGVTYHVSMTQETYDLMPMDDVQSGRLSSPRPEREAAYSMKQPPSSTSLDSFNHPESGYSPVHSPQKLKPKATVPNVSPELLHLV